MDNLEDNTYIRKKELLTRLFESRRELTNAPAGSVANENATRGALVTVDTVIEMIKGIPGTEQLPTPTKIAMVTGISTFWYGIAGGILVAGGIGLMIGSRLWYGITGGLLIAGILAWKLTRRPRS
jgi:hypothetical protein